jgi:hypothetical protein
MSVKKERKPSAPQSRTGHLPAKSEPWSDAAPRLFAFFAPFRGYSVFRSFRLSILTLDLSSAMITIP